MLLNVDATSGTDPGDRVDAIIEGRVIRQRRIIQKLRHRHLSRDPVDLRRLLVEILFIFGDRLGHVGDFVRLHQVLREGLEAGLFLLGRAGEHLRIGRATDQIRLDGNQFPLGDKRRPDIFVLRQNRGGGRPILFLQKRLPETGSCFPIPLSGRTSRRRCRYANRTRGVNSGIPPAPCPFPATASRPGR